MTTYIPPTFPMYEYSSRHEANLGRRWINAWHGAVGAPAETVVLGWQNGTEQALVSTRLESYSPNNHDGRLDSIFLVVGGTTWDTSDSTAPAGLVHKALTLLPDKSDIWRTESVQVDVTDQSAEIAYVTPTIAAGHLSIGGLAISFAVRGMSVADVRLGKLAGSPGSGYLVHPFDRADNATLGTISLRS